MVDVWWRRTIAMGIAMGLGACGSSSPPGTPDGGGDAAADARSDAGADAPTDAPYIPPGAGSCRDLPKTCGASADESCCSSPALAAGTYYRGYDLAGDSGSGSTRFPAKISAFRLDKFEITVGRFRAFVSAGLGTRVNPPAAAAGAHAALAGSGWNAAWNASLAADTAALTAALQCDQTFQTWTASAGGNENRPMNCITWYEAMAFCAWDGGYLATEAEWNYAAAGGEEQRAYPWSSAGAQLQIDAQRASYNDGTCAGDGQAGCAVTDLILVGTKPSGNGRWGQAELAGNVMEWTLDWTAAYQTPCEDCANLTATTTRTLRGGFYNASAAELRSGLRGGVPPSVRSPGYGARCARAL